VICTLPAGVGETRAVVARVCGLLSEEVWSVGYGAPAIQMLEGCLQAAPSGSARGATPAHLTDCPREAGASITLRGENFGASKASVLVGGDDCVDVTHDANQPHNVIVCRLPGGAAEMQPILLFQNGGSRSPRALVSYQQCAEGSTNGQASACVPCAAGTSKAVSGGSACLACATDSYSLAGAAECDRW